MLEQSDLEALKPKVLRALGDSIDLLDKRVSLQEAMGEATKQENWSLLEKLAKQALAVDPQWLNAATLLQRAQTEIVVAKYPDDPEVQRLAETNRFVHELAKKS